MSGILVKTFYFFFIAQVIYELINATVFSRELSCDCVDYQFGTL